MLYVQTLVVYYQNFRQDPTNYGQTENKKLFNMPLYYKNATIIYTKIILGVSV